MRNSFFDTYFDYTGVNEVPMIYRRWAIISTVAALLGRNYYLPFGHGAIYPNMYNILIGSPGARKGEAMKPIKKLLGDAGYTKFGADKTSAERFIVDLQRSTLVSQDLLSEMEDFENVNIDEPSELFVVADEFADFIGLRNMSFINTLTKMWDCPTHYEHPKIHGKSVLVIKPTVNIFAATTPRSLMDTIPPEAIGQGFTSRFIFIHSSMSDNKVTWPTPRDMLKHKAIVENLKVMIKQVKGPASFTPGAQNILDRMYKEFVPLDDPRFQFYNTRRFTHLLKLCLILSAMRCTTAISIYDAIQANTILHMTEKQMPRALGELGRSRYSDINNNILELVAQKNLSYKDLWKQTAHDLDKEADLHVILRNLISAKKLQVVTVQGKKCYKRNITQEDTWDDVLLDSEFLTKEELMYV